MASHYLFDPSFCNPASGWEKGQIEKNVQDSRRRFWQVMPGFATIDALNDWLELRCIEEWSQIQHGTLPGTIAEVWATEKPSLMPLGRLFDGFVEHAKRVSPTCLISFERNRYSVPASFANRPVSVRVYPNKIAIAAEGQILCEHVRRINRSHLPGCTIYDWRHYLAVLQRKPGALRNGAPFTEMPDAFRRLQGYLLKRLGATARWSISWRWFCSMMSKPSSRLLSWRWKRAFPARPISSTFCTGFWTQRDPHLILTHPRPST